MKNLVIATLILINLSIVFLAFNYHERTKAAETYSNLFIRTNEEWAMCAIELEAAQTSHIKTVGALGSIIDSYQKGLHNYDRLLDKCIRGLETIVRLDEQSHNT